MFLILKKKENFTVIRNTVTLFAQSQLKAPCHRWVRQFHVTLSALKHKIMVTLSAYQAITDENSDDFLLFPEKWKAISGNANIPRCCRNYGWHTHSHHQAWPQGYSAGRVQNKLSWITEILKVHLIVERIIF